MTLAAALLLALASTVLVNLAYVHEQAAAASLPPLSLRRPLASLALLTADRGWLRGFAMETAGFVGYVGALALAQLALVQSVGAGGVGLLAAASARRARRRMSRREIAGVAVAGVGLGCLAISLANGGDSGTHGATAPIVAWLAASAGLAMLVRATATRSGDSGAAHGIAGGLLLSVGDISTKVATQGGIRVLFALGVIGGYVVGTSLLQIGYQRGGPLAVAGTATLLTNALPIAAGTVLLGEPIPGGALGVLRVIAFASVVLGAILLARPARGTSYAAVTAPA